MTGYGFATGQIEDATYILEIKTVNSRYLKTHIKLPDWITFLEEDIEALLRKGLYRGTVYYNLRLKNNAETAAVDVDQRLLQKYLEKLTQFVRATDANYNIDLASLLSAPGVVQPAIPDEQQAQKIKNQILDTTRLALDDLKQMRAAEGTAIEADLNDNCRSITSKLQDIQQRSSLVLKEYHDKLKKRVDDLLADVKIQLDPETLAREVAVYADRCDISEEITRLDSHLQQFLQSCTQTEHPGRKLDFITQEMLREANTIASKAADTEIAQAVLDIKCSIDRLKEQAQNVE